MSLNDLGVSLSDLTEYVEAGGTDVPFPTPICDFPVSRHPRPPRTFEETGEAPPPHVPSFLPAFPDAHTYRATPSFPGAEPADAGGADAKELAAARAARAAAEGDERRGAESSLVRLAARAEPDNPLLAPALERGHAGEGGRGEGEKEGEGRGEAGGEETGGEGSGVAAPLAPGFANPFLESSGASSALFSTPQWRRGAGRAPSAAAARWGAAILPPEEFAGGPGGGAGGAAAASRIDPAAPPEAVRLDASAAARARAAETMRAAAPLFAPGDAWGPAPEAPAGVPEETDAFDAPEGAGPLVARGGRALKRSQRALDGGAAGHDPLRARAEAVLAAAEKGTDLLGPAPGGIDADDVERV